MNYVTIKNYFYKWGVHTITALLISAFAFTLLFLTGCNKKLYPQPSTDRTDSVRIEYIERVRYDTVTIEVPVEKDMNISHLDTTSYVSTSLAFSEAGIRDGMLWHTIENRRDTRPTVIIPVKDTETTTDHTTQEVIREPYPVPAEFTWWQKMFMNVGRVTCIVLTVLLGIGIWWVVRKFIL